MEKCVTGGAGQTTTIGTLSSTNSTKPLATDINGWLNTVSGSKYFKANYNIVNSN